MSRVSSSMVFFGCSLIMPKNSLFLLKKKNVGIAFKSNLFMLSFNSNWIRNDILERIKISNLNSISEFDLITHKMRELLAIDNFYR